MIKKKTEREFDVEYNQWDKWPIEMTWRVYCDLVDEINKELDKKADKRKSTAKKK